MLTDREVLSTLNMLRNEHLDVRTVTLGISLFDCAAHDFDVFAYKVRAKISRYAGRLVETCNDVADKYGIPVVNKRISVSPIGVVGASRPAVCWMRRPRMPELTSSAGSAPWWRRA